MSDAKAREMSLQLLGSCQQLNVYGPIWTEGMWDEIHHASKLGIPMMTDQKTIGRTPPGANPLSTFSASPWMISHFWLSFMCVVLLVFVFCGNTAG